MKTMQERRLSRMLKRAGIPKEKRTGMLAQMTVPERKGGLVPPRPEEIFSGFPLSGHEKKS
ncbi:MAG: hypothetical protein IJJ34_06885 [Clostridia bacterium]|nr:hypothetical protein [Clostridia bacterium]